MPKTDVFCSPNPAFNQSYVLLMLFTYTCVNPNLKTDLPVCDGSCKNTNGSDMWYVHL